MAERKFSFVPGEYYHVYNRGHSKQNIFLDAHDYNRFQRLLFLANSEYNFKIETIRSSKQEFYAVDRGRQLVAIGAYCLMPNHFHILLTPLVGEDDVGNFMRKLGTGYSMYFNEKYDHSGSLCEGKYKASIAENDVYLKYLFSYIHLNPVKLVDPLWKVNNLMRSSVAKQYLELYPYSSYVDYVTALQRKESRILDVAKFPPYFKKSSDLEKDMYSWFSDRKDLSA
jgi:putative transposase